MIDLDMIYVASRDVCDRYALMESHGLRRLPIYEDIDHGGLCDIRVDIGNLTIFGCWS